MFERIKFAVRMGYAFYKDNKGQGAASGIVAAILGFIVVFYVLAYTYDPLEDAAVTLKNELGNATITGISGLDSLPGVAVLLFVLITILGLVMMAVGRREL